jgi:subtilisin-like proprotein convertase family protein
MMKRSRRFYPSLDVTYLEDRVVPVKDLAGNLLLDEGYGYWYGDERIPLYIRADEVAVEVSATNSSFLPDLPNRVSALSGFQIRQQLSPTLAIFGQPEMTPGDQLGVQYATRLANLAQSEGIVSASPAYSVRDRDTWLVTTDQVAVRLDEGVSPAQLFGSDPRFLGWEQLSGTPDTFLLNVKGGRGLPVLSTSDSLKGLPGVIWSTPNFIQNAKLMAMTNDTILNKQWHLHNTGPSQYAGSVADADVDAPEAWDITFGGSPNITVAIVDDGMDLGHPDLLPNLWKNVVEVNGAPGVDDDGNGWVDDFNGWDFNNNDNNPGADTTGDAHATSVAGVTAAKGNNNLGVAGIAFNAKIMPIRIFAPGFAGEANTASAIYYSAGRTKNGLGTWRAADVANHSWGGGAPSVLIRDALIWANTFGREGKGVVSFVATGNSGASSISFPARFAGEISGVIAVGASTNADVRSSYSQFGPEIDFVSPSNGGSFGIVTTDRRGSDGYNNAAGTAGDYTNTAASAFGGTSSATPLAAGIGALILSLDPNLKASEVRGLMRNTTDYIGPGSIVYGTSNGFNLEYGFGRVNAFTAVSGVGKPEIQVIDGRTDVPSNGTAVNFGTVNVGSYVSRTFRIRNQGTLPLNLGQFAITGPFVLESGISDFRLAVGEMTTLTVRFLPTANGSATGQLTFLTNDSDESNFVINLNGTGSAVSISGYVFEDVNGDGVFQPNEPGLVGHQVKLNGATVATTDTKGYYNFASVAPGTHSVTNPALAGWNRTTLDTFSVTLAAGDSKTGFNFGLGKQDTAYGRVAIDLNMNGILEPSEQGLPNWTVFNDVNNNNAIDFAATKTYASGVINLPIPVGAPTTTSGTMSHTIPLAASGKVADVNVLLNVTHTWNSDLRFTLFSPDGTSSIIINAVGGSSKNFTNTVLDDQATTPIASGTGPFNGTFIPSNPLSVFNGKSIAGNWKLQIDDLETGDWGTLINWEVRIIDNSGEAFTLSNSSGNYQLPLSAGAANIRVVQQPTWTPTTPASGKYSFTHTAGATKYANDFGQRKDTNTPPANPNAGGPYSITEGDSLTLIGSATDADGDALLFSWDVNGDGTFGDAFGTNVTLTWAQLVALGINDGPMIKTVSLKVTDVISPWITAPTTSLTVTNADPTATNFTNSGPVTEFNTATISIVGATDASTADVSAGLRYAFDFGDDGTWDVGSTTYDSAVTTSSITVPASFLNDNGVYIVRGRLIDKDSGFTEFTTSITVTNAKPTAASFSNGGSVQEGSAGLVTVNGASDVSPVDTAAGLRFAYDFGADGTWEIGNGLTYATASTTNSVVVPASYLPDGPRTVNVLVRVFDKDDAFNEYSTSINVINAKPTAVLNNAGIAIEGQATSVNFQNQADPSPTDTVAGFKYAFDFNNDGSWDLGSGSTYTAGVSTFNPTIPASFITEGPATLTVRARIFDKDGAFNTYTTTITIQNANPAASFSNLGAVLEGQLPSVQFSNTVDSPQDLAAGLKYAFDFDGDGNFEIGGADYLTSVTTTIAEIPAQFLPDGSGQLTVTGRIYDRDGGYAEYQDKVSILNANPTATLTNGGSVLENTPGQVSFSNPLDASVADTLAGFRYAYDFNNDGVFDLGDGTYALSSALSTVTVPAKYLSNGPFSRTITARIIDRDDGFTDYTTVITVTNTPPNATFAGTATTTEGSLATVGFSNQTDDSPVDFAAGFRYAFDFNNDGKWDLGNGTYTSSVTTSSVNVPASYLTDGPFSRIVNARIIDQNDGFRDFTWIIAVTGVAPTATISNNGPVREGEVATILLSDRKDISPEDQAAGFRYAFDFNNDGIFDVGNGTFAGSEIVPAITVPAKYLTNGPGQRTVRVRIIDKDNDTRDLFTNIGVTNLPPTASLIAPAPGIVGEPTFVTFLGATDPSPEDVAAGLRYSFSFSGQPGFTGPGDVSNSLLSTAGFAYTIPGTYQVMARVADRDGAFTEYNTTVVVRNVPPTAKLMNSGDVVEGGVATVSFTNSKHPSSIATNAGFRYAYDFNNDGVFELGTGQYESSVPDAIVNVPAELLADGPVIRTIRARIIEVNGLFTDYTTTIQVSNAAPSATFLQPAVGPVYRNSAFPLSFTNGQDASRADAGQLKYRVELTTPGTVQVDPATGIPVSVTLTQPGRQLIRGIVSDPNGAETVYPMEVTIQSQNWYAVGPDNNQQPIVKLFNAAGQTQFSQAVFGDWVTSGVRVATADFNADGIPDLVAATGPGVMGQVRIIDGQSGKILADITAFEERFTGGVFVATGDITGDGRADLVISPDEGGGPRVRVFDGNTFKNVADFFGIDDVDFRGGARASLGDLNGDGFADLVVSAGFGGGPRVAGFDGRALLNGQATRLFADFFVYEQGLRNGAYVAVGDIDGDGKAELITGGGPGGGPRVQVFASADLMKNQANTMANFFAGDQNNRGGIRIAAKDLDGDGKAEVVTGAGTNGGSRVSVYRKAAQGLALLQEFDAYDNYAGGVFVG